MIFPGGSITPGSSSVRRKDLLNQSKIVETFRHMVTRNRI